MIIQSLEFADQLIETMARGNQKRKSPLSLSRVYKALRKNSAFDYFGDYVLLAHGFFRLLELGYRVNRSQLQFAMRMTGITGARRGITDYLEATGSTNS